MTLAVSDLPAGLELSDESPYRIEGVRDGFQRLFISCFCPATDSAPLMAVSQTLIIESEGRAKLSMKAAETEQARAEITSGLIGGSEGQASDVELRLVPGPKLGDETRVFELGFQVKDLGRLVGYLGIVRIRNVQATVAIVDRPGRVAPQDVHGLMDIAVRRVRGEPLTSTQVDRGSPTPAAQST